MVSINSSLSPTVCINDQMAWNRQAVVPSTRRMRLTLAGVRTSRLVEFTQLTGAALIPASFDFILFRDGTGTTRYSTAAVARLAF